MRETFEDRENQNRTREASGDSPDKPLSREEQYIRRAEKAERELLGEEWEESVQGSDPRETERAYEDLVDRLKAAGVYREEEPRESGPEDSSGDIAASPGGKVSGRKGRRFGHVRLGRVAGLALLCGACVFAASMTSEANREYFINNIRYLTGNDTRVLVYNDESNDSGTIEKEEEEAVQVIEDKLGIEMPEFYYRPLKLEFLDYEIDEDMAIARIEYQYKEEYIITFLIDRQDENTASKTNSAHGKNIETVKTVSDGIMVIIEETKDDQDQMPSITAQWERENVLYHLSGKIELEEMIKMMEEMKF